MIDEKNFFDLPVENDIKTQDYILKITTGQCDDYAIVCLLYYAYFKDYCELTAIDLRKLQALDANANSIQKINFTRNLDGAGNSNVFHF